MDVKVYTTPTCGYCHQAKNFLSERGIQYAEYDVSQNRAAAEEMMTLTGQMGVPVIVIDGQPVIGFDRNKLESLLTKSSQGNRKRPKFGLKVADASKMARKAGGLPVFGAYVGSVAPGSIGEKAGIRPGDIITEVNLRQVNSAAELEQAISKIKSGGQVTLAFVRGQDAKMAQVSI